MRLPLAIPGSYVQRTNSDLKTLLICFLLVVVAQRARPQDLGLRYAHLGTAFSLSLSTAPFPHPLRDSGHVYQGKAYPFDLHYSDSTVGVFVPRSFQRSEPFDLVIHVHGWFNNVDSVFAQFQLAEQLTASGRNAILVVPQGPKNAPDSFGGQLEEANAFQDLVDDILDALRERKIVDTEMFRGIVLSGHSGAYRMISFILMRGGITEKIREVYLFDALYGHVEKYAYWLDHFEGRFVAIYTNDGGTKGTTDGLIEDLDAWEMAYAKVEELAMTDEDLRDHRIVFIHTDLGHNEVINGRGQFARFLKTGSIP